MNCVKIDRCLEGTFMHLKKVMNHPRLIASQSIKLSDTYRQRSLLRYTESIGSPFWKTSLYESDGRIKTKHTPICTESWTCI